MLEGPCSLSFISFIVDLPLGWIEIKKALNQLKFCEKQYIKWTHIFPHCIEWLHKAAAVVMWPKWLISPPRCFLHPYSDKWVENSWDVTILAWSPNIHSSITQMKYFVPFLLILDNYHQLLPSVRSNSDYCFVLSRQLTQELLSICNITLWKSALIWLVVLHFICFMFSCICHVIKYSLFITGHNLRNCTHNYTLARNINNLMQIHLNAWFAYFE